MEMELSKADRATITAELLYVDQERSLLCEDGMLVVDPNADDSLLTLAIKTAPDAKSLAESVACTAPTVSFVRSIRGNEFANAYEEALGPDDDGGGPTGGRRPTKDNVIDFGAFLTNKAA